MEEFFKTPTQEEVDRQWLTQLCYDGDMADDEIEEFVDAVIQWKDKAVQCALADVVGQSEQFTADKVIEVLNDCDHLDDAKMWFTEYGR